MVERRRSQRVNYSCKIKLDHPQLNGQVVTCRDISDTGLYILISNCDKDLIGSTLQLQVITSLPRPKTRLTKIVRSDTDGIGLKFIA